jgi:hypothetical protein
MSETIQRGGVQTVDPNIVGVPLEPYQRMIGGLEGLGSEVRGYSDAYLPARLDSERMAVVASLSPLVNQLIAEREGGPPVTPNSLQPYIPVASRLLPYSSRQRVRARAAQGDLVSSMALGAVRGAMDSHQVRATVNRSLDTALPYLDILTPAAGEASPRVQFQAEVETALAMIQHAARVNSSRREGVEFDQRNPDRHVKTDDVVFGIERLFQDVLAGEERVRTYLPMVTALVGRGIQDGYIRPERVRTPRPLIMRAAAASIIKTLNEALPENRRNLRLERSARHLGARMLAGLAGRSLPSVEHHAAQVITGLRDALPADSPHLQRAHARLRRAFAANAPRLTTPAAAS